jgi:RNAse (barnase) inhibitor barstar
MNGNYTGIDRLVDEIQRREETKLDLIAPSHSIVMDSAGENIRLQGKEFPINNYAHGQIADRLEIPRKYYRKLDSFPDLKSTNVNTLLQHDNRKHLVRSLDGTARAFLSDRFRPIDHAFVISAFLPALADITHLQFHSLSLTDQRMYVQISSPAIQGEVVPGDAVQMGITLTNSEVGAGAVDIQTMIWRLICSNGMIRNSLIRQYHIGKRLTEGIENFFSEDTTRAELESFRLRIRDTVSHAFSEVSFHQELELLRRTAGQKIEKPETVVENVTKRFNLSELQKELTLSNLVSEGQMSRWGMANAITTLVHRTEDQDEQYELEKIGSRVIDMSTSEWEEMIV